MLLSSILITSDGDSRPPLPPVLGENIETLKRHHPGLPHRLFVEEDVLELIREKFSKEILDAYLAMRPYAFRADLARYCILYEFGGLYADLAYFFVRQAATPEGGPVVFRGNLVSSPWDTSNGIIFMPPKHKAMARAIEIVCENVARRYYGSTPLCPTGPVVLGKALAQTCEAEEITTGSAVLVRRAKVRELAPDLVIPRGERIHCQVMKDQLIAVKRKSLYGAGLRPFGIDSGNSYRELWQYGQVYS